MKNRILIGALIGLFFFSFKAQAQDDAADIKKAIMTMFDGMRAGDSAMVHSVFTDKVIFQRVQKVSPNGSRVVNNDFKNFLKAVGTPHDLVWDERIVFGPIQIDGDMASAWVPFKFYLGEKFSHCGVNIFQLFRTEQGWKVFHLVDTNRKENCVGG
ncbi:Cif family virulence factor [Roseivirga misakiensis]|uniref:DUF4440 domain-containing protein n=1 Tax=Roseivirga misakiensis TaxID=1563681 RepID=A0A1E5T307_9BACT|nr:nuclear transport factor 2 family protein [Roseivirga misakiensis]OEK05768.1 hypothetical protein BFP71_06505 [Roseivirga misakiensis]